MKHLIRFLTGLGLTVSILVVLLGLFFLGTILMHDIGMMVVVFSILIISIYCLGWAYLTELKNSKTEGANIKK